MNDKNTEAMALSDAELEQVNGGLYWNGSGWTSQGTVSSGGGSATHNGMGFTSVNFGSESRSLPSTRSEVQGGHRVIIGNRGQGEFVVKKIPL